MKQCLIAGVLAMATPALAQTGGGSTMSAPAPTSAIAPSSGSPVGQPPQNSAMRHAAGGGAAARSIARANPMGMAGMSGGSQTNALTLSNGSGGGSGRSSGQRQGQGSVQGQDSVRITDTGVTQRSQAGQQGSR